MYCLHVARSIGEYCGHTDGKKRVEVLSKDLSVEDKAAILADFTRADGFIRMLFASIVIGMGTHIFGLYNLWRIGQPRSLVAWVQQLGRVGRDRGDSEARLYWFMKNSGWESCMKRYCTSGVCLTLLICWHFDQTVTESFLRDAQSSAGYGYCCGVCAAAQARNTAEASPAAEPSPGADISDNLDAADTPATVEDTVQPDTKGH